MDDSVNTQAVWTRNRKAGQLPCLSLLNGDLEHGLACSRDKTRASIVTAQLLGHWTLAATWLILEVHVLFRSSQVAGAPLGCSSHAGFQRLLTSFFFPAKRGSRRRHANPHLHWLESCSPNCVLDGGSTGLSRGTVVSETLVLTNPSPKRGASRLFLGSRLENDGTYRQWPLRRDELAFSSNPADEGRCWIWWWWSNYLLALE